MRPNPLHNIISVFRLAESIRESGRESVERLARSLGHPRPHLLSPLALVKWVAAAAQKDREKGYEERTKQPNRAA